MASPDPLRTFQRRLLRWYGRSQRDLPWRKTRDPYKILVSEIMLQQTQVDRVVPKYHEFLRRYPTLEALAQARTAELRRTWYPLGYNVRPLRLRRIAQRTLQDHRGRIPNSYDGLLAMDGIGRYTAGAVLSFAFKKDWPIVDTNVARLLARYFGVAPRPGPRVRRRLWQLAEAVIPRGQGHLINQAMMDFGATVCTARTPRCPTCALRRTCRSFPFTAKTRVSRPIPPRTGKGEMRVALAVIERRGRYLICQRRSGDVLGGYWEFPGGKREPGESWTACLRRELREELGVAAKVIRPFARLRYRQASANSSIFFAVYRCTTTGRPRPLAARTLKWVSAGQLSRFRFPPANRGLIAKLKARR